MCYKDGAEGGKEMAKDKIPVGLSRFQRRAKSRNVVRIFLDPKDLHCK